jgi:hypothetical protein
MKVVMPGLTRHAFQLAGALLAPPWIAGQARNDRFGCHAGLDPASMHYFSSNGASFLATATFLSVA